VTSMLPVVSWAKALPARPRTTTSVNVNNLTALVIT
jgi:hypothetical protein